MFGIEALVYFIPCAPLCCFMKALDLFFHSEDFALDINVRMAACVAVFISSSLKEILLLRLSQNR